MTRDTGERTYAVGRGKPPAQTQFKPGQSGNLRGRPRGSVDFGRAILAATSETLDIGIKGRKKRRSKCDVAAIQLANKAASGDLRAIALLYKHSARGVPEPVAALPADQAEKTFGSEDDVAVWATFLQRIKEGLS